MSIRITAYNRGPDPATLHVIPQLWFRNTWSWPKHRPTGKKMPSMHQVGEGVIQTDQENLGRYFFHATSSPAPVNPSPQRSSGQSHTNDDADGDGEGDDDGRLTSEDIVVPELIFTDNDTNFERLYGGTNYTPYVKDAFHDHIIPSHRPPMPSQSTSASPTRTSSPMRSPIPVPTEEGGNSTPTLDEYHSDSDSTRTSTPTPTLPRQFVNPEKRGTKAAAHYIFQNVPANGGCAVVRVKLTKKRAEEDASILDEEVFDCVVEERRADADEFYSRFNSGALSDDLRNIMRQALSGMLWYVASANVDMLMLY